MPSAASPAIEVGRYAPALCKMDNTNSDVTSFVLATGEYQNTSSEIGAVASCSVPIGPGWDAVDVTYVRARIYDDVATPYVYGYLGTRSTSGSWSSCPTQTSDYGYVGEQNLFWQGATDLACMNFTDRWAVIRLAFTYENSAGSAHPGAISLKVDHDQ